ncbi:hypothetical protein BOX15_Mlig011155g1, partial [Macrostomum lignano]
SSPCQKFACAIQDCLARHNYNPEECRSAMQNLIDCCARFRHVRQSCCELGGGSSSAAANPVSQSAKSSTHRQDSAGVSSYSQ